MHRKAVEVKLKSCITVYESLKKSYNALTGVCFHECRHVKQVSGSTCKTILHIPVLCRIGIRYGWLRKD